MATLTCPVCKSELHQAGRTDRCPTCTGAWIHEDVLVGMLQERAATLVELPWQPRADSPRACAVCASAMQTVNLGSVALDRCPQHGVWFDPEELAAVIAEAKHFKSEHDHEHHEGILRVLARLLGR